MQEVLLDVAKRFPLVAGIAGMALGVFALYFGVVGGAEYHEFAGGAQAVGRVITAGSDAARDPEHAADTTWEAGGATHRALVEVWRYELPDERAPNAVRLRPGSSLPLILSTRDPDRAISARVLSERAIFTVGGRTLHGVPFAAGLGFILILNPWVFAYLAREDAAGAPGPLVANPHRAGVAIAGISFAFAAALWAIDGTPIPSFAFNVTCGLGVATAAAGGYAVAVERRQRRRRRPDSSYERSAHHPDGEVVTVRFAGVFEPGSDGNEFAQAMVDYLRSVLARERPRGVILDLTDLDYVFGDAISGLAMPLMNADKTFRPAAIVAQGATADALRPLLGPSWLLGIAGIRLFATVEEAQTFVERALPKRASPAPSGRVASAPRR